MTLGENKKITLALIEEYSPTNVYLTDDEDIANRLNLVYAPNYQELSQMKRIIKTKVLREITGQTENGYEEVSMPSNMYQLIKIVALDKDNNEIEAKYTTLGNKVLISKEKDAKYVLEYYMYPSEINEETPDNFYLELDQDAQMLLPYLVANDILKVDPSSDYTAFQAEYRRKLDLLNPRKILTSAVVEEGEI
jgi:hypothetical protein